MNNSRIAITNDVLFGKPRIKGTRISVEQILACLAQGWHNKKIMKEFEISEQDIKAAIDYAYRSVSRVHFIKFSSGKKAYV